MTIDESTTTVSLELTKREAETLWTILDSDRYLKETYNDVYSLAENCPNLFKHEMNTIRTIKKALSALRTAF